MAKNKIDIKKLPKGSRDTQTPSGQPGDADIVKGSIMDFSNTLTMDMASFFLGSAQDGSDMKKAQSKAQANRKSILGDRDSIYIFLQDIKESLTSKQMKELLPKSLMLIGLNSSIIKEALFDGQDSLLYNIDEKMNLLINNKLVDIATILSEYKGSIDKLTEKLSIYEKTSDKLFELNKEIRQNNEKAITEAKLKLIIEGIDDSTIESLINFSKINLDNSEKNAQSLLVFFEALKTISSNKQFDSKNLTKIENALLSVSNMFKTIKSMPTDNKLQQKIDQLSLLFANKDKKANSLITIFTAINKFKESKELNKNIGNLNSSVINLKFIIDNLNSLEAVKIDAKELKKNIEEYLKVLEATYKKIKKDFNQIIVTGETAKKVVIANENIKAALANTNETIVKTSTNEKDIKKSVIAIQGMTEFMIGAAIVMSIGALIVMMGGGKFIKAALQFGLTLAIFEGLVLMPALIFNNQKGDAFKGIEGFNSFIITCALTMTIGALVMMFGGGKLVKNALQFGITLGLFELIVVAPILAFSRLGGVVESLHEFNSFIVTCSIVMLIGALVVQLAGGKVIKNALKFGVVLMEFEALVVLPFILFGLIKRNVFEGAKDFTTLLVVTTIVFLVGAGVMALSGGKMVKYAMKFAITLMKFEALIIAPFLLFNLLKKQVFDGMKSFSVAVITCTITLLIGALVMKNPRLVQSAFKFATSLMIFEAMIIAPFLIFNKIGRSVMGGLKDFAIVVFATTTVLIVGSLFMTMNGGIYPIAAMEFAGLLALFEVAIVAPMLLFNKISKDALSGAKDFGIFVALSSFALIIGAFFIANYGSQPVLEFGIVLSGFVLIASGAAALMGHFGEHINKARDFGLFVLLSSAALLIGAFFITKYGAGSAIGYAILLGAFVAGISLVMFLLDKGIKAAGGEASVISEMAALGSFLLMATASIALGSWVIDKYGWKSVLYALLLVGFIGLMGLVFVGLTYIGAYIAPGAAVAALMGVALLLLTGSLMLVNLMFESDPGGKKILGNIGTLASVIMQMLIPFTLLGLLSIPIALGSVVATAMGVALLILGASLSLVNWLMNEYGQDLPTNISNLTELLGFSYLGGTFALLGILSPFILYGSLAAGAIGVSMVILGGALTLVNTFMNEHGEGLKGNIELLNELLGFSYLAGTYTLLGVLSPLIALGSAAGVLMSVSITILGGALALVNIFMDPIKDTIIENIEKMQEAVLAVTVLAGELILATIPMTLGLPGLGLMNIFCLGITTSSLMIAESVKQMNKVGDLSKGADKIAKNIQAFVDIPDKVSFGGILGILDKISTIGMISNLSMPLARTMKAIGVAVSDMANLKVATKWDKEGNPIAWRQLNDKDFDLVINNVGRVLTTMSSAFYQAWFGTGSAPFGIGGGGLKELAEDKNGAIWMTLYFGRNVGEVIKGIAEGVGSMAKMQIPIAWDEKGNPIGYRQLKDKDFDLASRGTQKILTSMAGTIITTYAIGAELGKQYNGGKNIFDAIAGGLFSDDKPSPFVNTLEATLKIGELIGNIGTAVGNIAKMQIPIGWDEKGKPIRFRTLKQADFTEMGKSVSTVLTSIITCLANLYARGKDFDPEHKNNIFDIVSGGWFSSDKPPAIMTVIDASMKVSELIANIGQGIKDIATMQIADRWNSEGKAIHYVKLQRGDFKEAAGAIGDIITCLVKALSRSDVSLYAHKAGYVTKQVLPISQLISDMADGIIKLASGQIPIEWDKEGKAIKFRKLNAVDYIMAGWAVSRIVSFMTTSLINAATQKGKDGSRPLLEIFDGDTFKNVVEAISGTGDLISNIADSVIKIGQGLVPDKWDKDGKAIHYKQIDMVKAQLDLQSVISTILMATIDSVKNVYYGIGMPGGLGIQYMIGKDAENSPFLLATQGIATITKTVSDIVDSVIKIGSALIPDKWDKDGKAIHFHSINVEDAISNIKKIFVGTNGSGLLSILCSVINDVADTYFSGKGSGDISESVGLVSDGMNTIIGIISKSTDLVIKISSLKIPTGYDKEGNAKGWQVFKPTDIAQAKLNMVLILTSLLSIFDTSDQENPITKYVNNIEDIKSKSEIINEGIIIVGTTISTTLSQIKNVIKYDKEISKLFKMKSYSKVNASNKDISIGSLRDVYEVINAYSVISKAICGIDFGDTNKLDKVSDHILSISSFISSTVLYLYSIVNDIKGSKMNDMIKYIYDPKAKEYLPTLVRNMVKIYVSSYHSLAYNSLTIASIEDTQKRLMNLQTNIVQIHKVLGKMFVNYSYLSKLIDNAKNNSINLQDVINTISFYKLSLKAVNNLYKYFFENKDISKGLNFSLLTYNLGQIANVIGTMFSGISDSYDIYYHNIQAFKDNITDIIGQLEISDNGLSISMQNLKNNLDFLENIYTTSFKNIDFSKNTILDDISQDLASFIYETIDPFDARAFMKARNLNTSIDNIYQTLSKQEDKSKAFKANTNALQTYIKAINGVDLKKVNSLWSLIYQLNRLAGQLGNLDKLTDAIANGLSEVLRDLVDSLSEAKNTIHDAHQLQASRAEQIERSIGKIRTLMNSPLNINVQASNTVSDPGMTPSDDDDTNNTNNPTSTSDKTPETSSTPIKTKKKPGSRA